MPENNSSMPKTRRSLFYLATYLFVTGLAFLLAPQTALQLLLANHPYSDVFVQFTGVMMVGLSIVVANVIRIADPRFYGDLSAQRRAGAAHRFGRAGTGYCDYRILLPQRAGQSWDILVRQER